MKRFAGFLAALAVGGAALAGTAAALPTGIHRPAMQGQRGVHPGIVGDPKPRAGARPAPRLFPKAP